MTHTTLAADRVGQDFKALCIEAITESGIKQEALADRCKTSQGTISRYFSYNQPHHLPAYMLHGDLMPKEVAVPILAALAESHEYTIRAKIPVTGPINGSIADEVQDMLIELGEITKSAKDRPQEFRRIAKHLPILEDIVARMREEVHTLSLGGHHGQ